MTRPDPDNADAAVSLRLDKWLWQARFFKTRGRAAEVVGGGHVRVNARPVSKPSHAVRVGDTLTFAQGRAIRVVRVVRIPVRRGPATEAQALYDDLSPPPPPAAAETGAPTPVVGRVDRKERRAARLSKRGPLE